MAKRAAPLLSPESLVAVRRLGTALKHARVRRRLTQAQLASRAGIGVATVQRMERGDPGLGLGSFLEVLAVLERNWLDEVVRTVESDVAGRQMELRRLPSRVVNRDDDF